MKLYDTYKITTTKNSNSIKRLQIILYLDTYIRIALCFGREMRNEYRTLNVKVKS